MARIANKVNSADTFQTPETAATSPPPVKRANRRAVRRVVLSPRLARLSMRFLAPRRPR